MTWIFAFVKNSGLDRFEAQKKLWAELEETGLAVKKEALTSRVTRCQRGISTYHVYLWTKCLLLIMVVIREVIETCI